MTILTDITERKNLEKYVLSKIIETEEKERRRIAADIHDELGPLISSARLQLGFLERSIAGSPSAQNERLSDRHILASISPRAGSSRLVSIGTAGFCAS